MRTASSWIHHKRWPSFYLLHSKQNQQTNKNRGERAGDKTDVQNTIPIWSKLNYFKYSFYSAETFKNSFQVHVIHILTCGCAECIGKNWRNWRY